MVLRLADLIAKNYNLLEEHKHTNGFDQEQICHNGAANGLPGLGFQSGSEGQGETIEEDDQSSTEWPNETQDGSNFNHGEDEAKETQTSSESEDTKSTTNTTIKDKDDEYEQTTNTNHNDADQNSGRPSSSSKDKDKEKYDEDSNDDEEHSSSPSPPKFPDLQCCGTYPLRKPFHTLGGTRSCCGGKTFNKHLMKCCEIDCEEKIRFECPKEGDLVKLSGKR